MWRAAPLNENPIGNDGDDMQESSIFYGTEIFCLNER